MLKRVLRAIRVNLGDSWTGRRKFKVGGKGLNNKKRLVLSRELATNSTLPLLLCK